MACNHAKLLPGRCNHVAYWMTRSSGCAVSVWYLVVVLTVQHVGMQDPTGIVRDRALLILGGPQLPQGPPQQYTLRSASSGLALDVEHGSKEDGAPLTQWYLLLAPFPLLLHLRGECGTKDQGAGASASGCRLQHLKGSAQSMLIGKVSLGLLLQT